MAQSDADSWPQQSYKVLNDANVTHVAYVPDAGHAELIQRFADTPAVTSVVLTTEEEGVAMLAGSWLGGVRGVLLMQSSGVGNCINMLGMIQECRFPLLMLVTMRGEWGEFNPWQVPMGQSTVDVLKNAGVIVHHVDHPAAVAEAVASAAGLAFDAYRAVAVLIGQRVIGTKRFE